MRDRTKRIIIDHGDEIFIVSTLILVTVLTGILITATGKVMVIELDGISDQRTDQEGNTEERHIDGGRLKFYAE